MTWWSTSGCRATASRASSGPPPRWRSADLQPAHPPRRRPAAGAALPEGHGDRRARPRGPQGPGGALGSTWTGWTRRRSGSTRSSPRARPGWRHGRRGPTDPAVRGPGAPRAAGRPVVQRAALSRRAGSLPQAGPQAAGHPAAGPQAAWAARRRRLPARRRQAACRSRRPRLRASRSCSDSPPQTPEPLVVRQRVLQAGAPRVAAPAEELRLPGGGAGLGEEQLGPVWAHRAVFCQESSGSCGAGRAALFTVLLIGMGPPSPYAINDRSTNGQR